MSTIASPRDPSLRRFPSPSPNSSARPSLDVSRSALSSPVNPNLTQPPPTGASSQQQQQQQPLPVNKRANRAALREFYNLRAPRIELPDSEIPASDLDDEDFDADEYVNKIVAESGLAELLKLYTRVVGEVRALDAEKKALVYDNYSKLITATETIRKMRTNMDPLNPMASTLDPAIAQIYSQASSIRETLREAIPPPDSEEGKKREEELRRRKTRELAIRVLAVPERLARLVREGRMDQARREWETPRKLLMSWKEKGIGGQDVENCIQEGDACLRPTLRTSASDDGRGSARTSQDRRSPRM